MDKRKQAVERASDARRTAMKTASHVMQPFVRCPQRANDNYDLREFESFHFKANCCTSARFQKLCARLFDHIKLEGRKHAVNAT